jgi:flagellar hook-basal body complex protein FliE
VIVSSVSGSGILPQASAPAASAGASFESFLTGLGRETATALKAGETAGIAAIEGKASIQQTVMATLEAEQALQAAIAIRDKIVGAINEITRMQI